MKKIDLRKDLKDLYAPSAKKVEIVTVPKFNFVMIDGGIGPGETPETSPEFRDAMMALYGASYTLKFMSKLRATHPVDYKVMALEGLWWTGTGKFDFDKKDKWKWTLMMMQPAHVTQAMFKDALRRLKEKKESPALSRLRLEPFQEGLCVQRMHVGPYSEEQRTIETLMVFAQEHGLRFRGKHHEIYFGDPRRTRPEKLKTILRHPVEKVGGR